MRRLNPFASALFTLPAAGYLAVQKLREKAYEWGLVSGAAAPVPVLSVGNLLLGGSGKTPFAIYLAELLRSKGMKPAVVSRGYRGTNREKYLVVGKGDSTPPVADSAQAGDEPFLIASRLPEIPVIVGRKRIHPVTAAHEFFGCDVVVLDDGFQHLELKRTVDIVLLRGTEDEMFPVGSLREPFSALKRAHIVVLAGPELLIPLGALRYVLGKPMFRCRLRPVGLRKEGESDTRTPDAFKGSRVVLLSAIAHPERFTVTAEKLGWKVVEHATFRDHHRFSDDELRDALQRAGGIPVVVTEKDWVKLPEWFRKAENVSALRVAMTIDEEAAFLSKIFKLIGRA